MRTLNEQWVEVIDGQEHMLKAVPEIYGCRGCFYYGECDECVAYPNAQCNKDTIIKDLGILNEDGLLPCPFCWEYPEIKYGIDGDGWHYVELSCCKYVDRMSGYSTDMEGFFRGMIERWNRRN